MIVVPVNPVSVNWASSYFSLMMQAASAKAQLNALLPKLAQFGELIVDPEGPEDEEIPSVKVIRYLDEAKRKLVEMRRKQPALNTLVEEIEKVIAYVGLDAELQALEPTPSFGVLSGTLASVGVEVPDWQVNQDLVIGLARSVNEARTARQGLPCMKAGTLNGTPVYLVSMGKPDEYTGSSIYPIGVGREQVRSAAATALGALILLWDYQAQTWKKGAALQFGLPMPPEKGNDPTESSTFVNFVTPKRVTYARGSEGVILEFGPNDVVAHGLLIGKETKQFVLNRVEKDNELTYQGTLGREPLVVSFEDDGIRLVTPTMSVSFPLKETKYVAQGVDKLLSPPAAVAWLATGFEQLKQDIRDPGRTSSKALASWFQAVTRTNASMDSLRSVVLQAAAALKDLRLGLVGSISGMDGAPRIMKYDPYYGSPPIERSLASQRTMTRRSLTKLPRTERVTLKVSETEKATIIRELPAPSFSFIEVERNAPGLAKGYVSKFSMEEFQQADGRAQRRLENALWKSSEAESTKTLRDIPLVGDSSPIQTLVITVWGFKGEMNYGVVWQSDPLSAAQLGEMFEEDPEIAMANLYGWVVEQSGIVSKAQAFGEKGPPISYAIIVNAIVSIPRLERLKKVLPKPYPLGYGKIRGTTERLGLYVTSLRVEEELTDENGKSVKTKIPSHVGKFAENQGLILSQLPVESILPVAVELGRVVWERNQKKLIPSELPATLFSLSRLEKTKEWERLFKLVQAEAEGEDGMSGEQVIEETWTRLMAEGVSPYFGKGGTPNIVYGGRRAFAALGGSKGQAVRKGQVALGTGGYSTGFMVSADPTNSKWATKKPGMYRDVVLFAASIIKQTGVSERGLKRVSSEVPTESEIQNLMGKYGITVDDFNDPQQYIEALEKLKRVLYFRDVAQPMNTGRMIDTLTASDFGMYQIDEMSRLNPRRRLRRNPLTESQLELATKYLESKKKEREPGDLPEFLSKARKTEGVGLYTPERVRKLFPREQIDGKDTWSPKVRLARSLGEFDAAIRVGAKDRPEQVVRAGRARSLDEFPLQNDDVLNLIAEEAGLSLETIGDILAAQRSSVKTVKSTKGKTRYSMQPSTAICKAYKGRRLTTYAPPKEVMESGNPRNYKVIILMSPLNAALPRVMTWRRGAHLDCDLVGRSPEELSELLGKAIQSSMLWLVEREGHAERSKRNRMAMTDILVGRVGQPMLYVAYKAGEQVSIDTITQNLQRAKFDSDYQINLYPEKEREARSERDIQRYSEAVGEMPARTPRKPRPEPVEQVVVKTKEPEQEPELEEEGPEFEEEQEEEFDLGLPGLGEE